MTLSNITFDKAPISIELLVQRYRSDDGYSTPGSLFMNGVYACDTIEDRVRANVNADTCAGKIATNTAIPAGRYEIGFAPSPRHKNILFPVVKDVPCFTGILIHGGWSQSWSSGCIIVGSKDPNSPGYLLREAGQWLNNVFGHRVFKTVCTQTFVDLRDTLTYWHGQKVPIYLTVKNVEDGDFGYVPEKSKRV